MNLKRFFALFSKKQVVRDLANLKDFVNIPKRQDFLDFSATIDKYKEDYLNALKTRKTILSQDLLPKELHDYKNIYIDLLSKICFEDKYLAMESINSTIILTSLDITINHLKMDIYQEKVTKLKFEALLRLVALSEISEETFLTPSKRSAVANEINNLYSAFLTFQNQELAMANEHTNFSRKVESVIHETDASLDENSILKERLNETIKLYLTVFPNQKERISKLDINPKLLIAYLETELEIYVYTHQKELDQLKLELENLNYEIIRNTRFCGIFENNLTFENNQVFLSQHKEEFEEKIRELEAQYKIFAKFGRNIIDEEELMKLYETKFAILTIDIAQNPALDITSKATFLEIECYQEIISKKISALIQGTNNVIKELIANSTPEYVISKIKSIFQNESKEFSFWSILVNHNLLAFLLAFDNEQALANFFRSIKVPKDNYQNLDFFDPLLTWEKEIPLESLYRVMASNYSLKNAKDEITKEPTDPLFYIFNLIPKEFSQEYRLPDGIIEISHDLNRFWVKNYDNVLKDIQKQANNHMVVLPKTLKKIYGGVFYEVPNFSVELNEGLEIIGDYAFLNESLRELIIPSSVYHIAENAAGFAYLKILGFSNYRFSKILNSEDNLHDLIVTIFRASLNHIHHHFISQYAREKQERRLLYGEDFHDDPSVYDHDEQIYYYDINLVVDQLVFINDDKKQIVLTKDELHFVSERRSLIYGNITNEHLVDKDIETIIKKIIELIDRKTGLTGNYGQIACRPTKRKKPQIYRG